MRKIYYKGLSENEEINKNIVNFFYTRLFYKSDEEIVRVYNKEYDINCENEKIQFLLFFMIDRIFRNRFDYSPIVIDFENDEIELLGKIKLLKPDKIKLIDDLLRKV